MEILELKSVWNAVVEDTISKDSVDEFMVENSIKEDSKSVLTKIKKVMYIKFSIGGLSLIVCSAMLVGSFIEPEKFTFLESIFNLIDNRVFLATIIIFMSAMLSWNFKAFRAINLFETNSSNVKASLARFINIMGQTIKLNIYSGAIFNAMALGWIFYLINNKKSYITGTIETILITTSVFISGVVLFYFLSQYEQKIKFGNYLNQLKSNLEDLQEK